MNARKVCVLCHWASLSGVFEAALLPSHRSHRALSPASRASSNANSTQRWTWGRRTTTSSQWTTPLLSREDHERLQEAMLVNPPHESFAREVSVSPDLLKFWSRKIASKPWVKAHERHPLVQSGSREERMLVALYVDATQLAKSDSLLVFTTHMLPS